MTSKASSHNQTALAEARLEAHLIQIKIQKPSMETTCTQQTNDFFER
jgi:hypothetical protein